MALNFAGPNLSKSAAIFFATIAAFVLGLMASRTSICGLSRPYLVFNVLVKSEIVLPTLPITIPGLAASIVIFSPSGVFSIVIVPTPASLPIVESTYSFTLTYFILSFMNSRSIIFYPVRQFRYEYFFFPFRRGGIIAHLCAQRRE